MNSTIQSVTTTTLVHRHDPIVAHIEAIARLQPDLALPWAGDLLDLTALDPALVGRARDLEARDRAEEIATAVFDRFSAEEGLVWDFAKFGNSPGGAPFAQARVPAASGETYIRFGIDEHDEASMTFRDSPWFVDVFDYASTDYLSTVFIPQPDVTAARIAGYVTAYLDALSNEQRALRALRHHSPAAPWA